MKTFLRILAAAILLPLVARAQFSNRQTNVTLLGASNNVDSTATFTFTSGSTIIWGGGSTNQLLAIKTSGGQIGTIGLGAGLSVSGGNLVAGSSSSANPSATVGLTAVNGSAGTFMTSDSAPALSQAIVPTWTGLHIFALTDTHTTGGGYGIEITPTLNQRNATFFSLIYGNETVTQAGSGNQYLEELAVGGIDKWVVDVSGNVKTGIWQGTAVGVIYGGTGLTSILQGQFLVATSNNVIGTLTAGIAGYVMVGNGTSLVPGWQPITLVLDTVGVPAQGVILERTVTSWQYISPGASGSVLMSNGTTSDPSYQAELSQLFTTTGDLVYSSSGNTASRLGIGTSGQVLTVSGGLPSWSTFSSLTNPMTATYDLIQGGTAGAPLRLAVGANNTFLGVNGSGVLGYYTVAGTTGANPSATVGTTAVNGSSTSFMRADGAPAINQALVPTWTATHTWSLNGTALALSGTGSVIRETFTVGANTWWIGMGFNIANAFEIFFAGSTPDAISIADSTTGHSDVTIYSTTASSSLVTGSLILGGGLAAPKYSYMAGLDLTPVAASSGTTPYFVITTPNDTGLTASTEANGIHLITGLRKWATTGTVATQREVLFEAPSYGSASASQTFTKAATVAISGAPIAGTNGIITNAYALWVQAGLTELDGTLATTGLLTKYNGVTTAGWGLQAVNAWARTSATSGAVPSVATFTPASDGDFVISATVDITTATLFSFSVTVTYKDDSNTSQTTTMAFTQNTGVPLQTLTNTTGSGDYAGLPIHIRAKGANAITVATTGTFTTVTYNVSAVITEVD